MLHARIASIAVLLATLAACASPGPSTDAPAPAAQASTLLVDMDGASHDLEAEWAAGRKVVLVFWQTWCASCREEAPRLAAAARANAGALRFLGVVSGPDSLVDEAEVRRISSELALPYPHVRDRDGSLSKRYAVTGTPTLIVLGPGGEELYRGHRAPPDWSVFASARNAAWSEDPEQEVPVLVVREGGVMGTDLFIEVIGKDTASLERAIDAAVAEVERIEALMTDWHDSPLSRLNDAAGGGPVEVPEELARLVGRGLEIGRLTKGAFDISYAAAGKLWDFKRKPPVVPDEDAIRAALQHVGWERVRVDLDASTIELPAGARLGLGGIAKGYGVDRAMAVLMQHGVQHALVKAGGDMKVLGKKHGEPWRIAVRHPRDRERALALLPVSNTCIATSGDYERFFELDGRRYHHILDPRTGRPATGCASATVVAQDAAFADALATALCVLPPAEGLELVESLPRVEAMLFDFAGEVHVSSGMLEGWNAGAVGG